MTSFMRRLFAVLATLAVSAGLLTLAAPAEAARTVTGTILGSDGRAVDAFIGFDLKDSSGRTIDKNGCLATRCGLHGYGITLRVNGDVPATGATDRTGHLVQWSITVPSATARMFIEVYPFSSGTYGKTDESRYGHSYRRNIAIPYPVRINLRLPLICSQGGTTGAIAGRATVGGSAATLKRVATWSLGADNNGPTPILGWNIGTASNGTFLLPNLPAGQKYQVLATSPSGVVKRYYDVQVNSCRTTTLNVAF
ncbi:MAG: hypothetical protein QOE05_825 [Actinomycetota bacterium]|jgi:hypothetical protein|nr:hypothetical protein [Actinomycetota bacterium]